VKLVISDPHEGLEAAITRMLCATFRDAFARHMTEQSRNAGSDERAAEAELRRVETKTRNLVSAISAGVASVLEELRSAEARKEELVRTIAQMNAPAPSIPVDAGAQYRKVVQALGAVLSNPALVVRARDQLGAMIDRIIVKEINKCQHQLKIVANPAAVFSLIDPAVIERLSTESSPRMVAGA
jgi:hypothetical protein